MPRRKSKGGLCGRDDWSKHEKTWVNILHREIFETGTYFKRTSVKSLKPRRSKAKANRSRESSEEDEGFEDGGSGKPYVKMIHLTSKEYLDQLKELISQLEERVSVVSNEISNLEGVDKKANQLADRLMKLTRSINQIVVWNQDHAESETKLQELRSELEETCSAARELHTTTRKQLSELGQLLPPDTQEKLSTTELTAEKLVQQLEDMEAEHKRARTVRYEFQVDVEEVQFWISRSESSIQDRSLQPHTLKENLNQIQGELGKVTEQLATLVANGAIIMAKTDNSAEKDLVASTTSNLSEQLGQLNLLIEEKKNKANDALDAWQKFLTMAAGVRSWLEERTGFLDEPLTFTSLSGAKLRSQDYAAAIKSVKNVNKSLVEMGRELVRIQAAGSPADLPDRLSELEKEKGELESSLVERAALLQELTEEWEQCERKLKETNAWAVKARDSLESLANKKRPIRDQLNLREKMSNDVVIQRKRAVMALEKLQVHFTAEMVGDQDVYVLGREIDSDLEALTSEVKVQAQVLESCLSQLDQYQQEIGLLRQSILSCEGELRTVSSPAYLAKDRDKAVAEQSACRERIKGFQSKITAFTQRSNLINQRGTPDTDVMTS